MHDALNITKFVIDCMRLILFSWTAFKINKYARINNFHPLNFIKRICESLAKCKKQVAYVTNRAYTWLLAMHQFLKSQDLKPTIKLSKQTEDAIKYFNHYCSSAIIISLKPANAYQQSQNFDLLLTRQSSHAIKKYGSQDYSKSRPHRAC